MKLFTLLSLASFSALGLAADAEEVEFLTAFVSDYDDNKKQYVDYFMTATDIPKGLTKLAKEVITYTDDSYTTLLDSDDIDIDSLMSFAEELPWYSRLNLDAAAASGSGSASTSGSSGSTSSSKTTSSADAGVSLLAPGGAILGALCLMLL